MFKEPIVANYTLFTVIKFNNINSFAYNNSIHLPKTNFSHTQKDYYQDDLSFNCLQFYKLNCLNVLAGNICFCKQVKNH